MLYFAAHTLKAGGGIMVTGSHNPPDHNGFKFVFQNKAFYGEDIQALRKRRSAAISRTARASIENKRCARGLYRYAA